MDGVCGLCMNMNQKLYSVKLCRAKTRVHSSKCSGSGGRKVLCGLAIQVGVEDEKPLLVLVRRWVESKIISFPYNQGYQSGSSGERVIQCALQEVGPLDVVSMD